MLKRPVLEVVADRLGALEAADGGTLFLDEVGELPFELQPKLLRALERFEVRRVGDNTSQRVDIRFRVIKSALTTSHR